jgi:serine protease Do
MPQKPICDLAMTAVSALRRSLAVALTVALAGAAAAQPATKTVPPGRAAVEYSFAPLVKQVAPAVVNVYTRRIERTLQPSPLFDDPLFRRFFGDDLMFGIPRERVQQSLGSGVIVEPDGVIVTNNHVIEGAQEIVVALADRREFEATVIAADARSDLAVLRIDTKGEKLPHLEYRDSDELEVGDLVLAIGNPFGVGQTVTSGIVSALGRTGVGGLETQSFIQTDAAINPGNSGGALVTMDGRLVGINTAIYSRTGGSLGIGFAIPSNLVAITVQNALGGKGIVRPWLGASGQPVTADIAQSLGLRRPEGILINEIYPGGPADRAGLRAGDVVLSVDGREVFDVRGLRYRVATRKLGDAVVLDVLRGGRPLRLNVLMEAAPEVPPRQLTRLGDRHPLTGATVGNLSPAFAEELGIDPMLKGVIVTELAPGSPAALLRLRPGDIIVKVDDAEITDVDRLRRQLARPSPAGWRIVVRRGDQLLNLVVRP